MNRLLLTTAIVALSFSAPAYSALVLTQNDGASPVSYGNGGGGGFGGTLGNGQVTMDIVGSNLVVGFIPGNSLNDLVALFLDTRAGGFNDAQMNDQADGGRRALSNLTANDNDLYPTDNLRPVLPDFGVIFASFGVVVFELTAGNTNGHLNFLSFTGVPGSTSIPLSTLGNPGKVDFFAGYVADSGFNSNEALPFSTALNAGGNPGFGDGSGVHSYDNFNRFITTPAPEPSTFVVWGLLLSSLGIAVNRRRSNLL